MKPLTPPRRVAVERDAADSLLLERLRRTLPGAAFETVERLPERPAYDPNVLEIARFKGRFFKPCPGTRRYHCCNYQILHFGLQCSLGCGYCILQAYHNAPNLRLFGNIDEMFAEARAELSAHPGRLHRVGTGEFTDSLLLDPWTELSRDVVSLFAGRDNAVVELKTKTGFIANLEGLEHGGNAITAWSLNSPHIRRSEEARCATLSERLAAARRCAEWGYYLAFHFDPMVAHEGWREGYGATLDRLFDAVDPARVVYVSLGAFRFMPDLKRVIRRDHPRSPIVHGEFIRGMDDKSRYFRDIRVELFSFMAERFRQWDPELCVYLCMENSAVWRDALGFAPEGRGGLPKMLDDAVRSRMGVGLDCVESAPGADGKI